MIPEGPGAEPVGTWARECKSSCMETGSVTSMVASG